MIEFGNLWPKFLKNLKNFSFYRGVYHLTNIKDTRSKGFSSNLAIWNIVCLWHTDLVYHYVIIELWSRYFNFLNSILLINTFFRNNVCQLAYHCILTLFHRQSFSWQKWKWPFYGKSTLDVCGYQCNLSNSFPNAIVVFI